MNIEFKGKLLKDTWEFNKEDGGIWTIRRKFDNGRELPQLEEEAYAFHTPQKTDVRFEVDAENLEEETQYEKILTWMQKHGKVIVEPKLLGLRAIVSSKGQIFLEGNEKNRAKRYPELSQTLNNIEKSVILDAELVDKTLHVFSILALEGKDLRDKSELERKQILKKAVKPINTDLVLMPYEVINGDESAEGAPPVEVELLKVFIKAMEYENSEGAMLKATTAVTTQRRNIDWAKVKSIIQRVAVIQGKRKVKDKEAWTYQLGFKNVEGEIYSPGTSMSTTEQFSIDDHVIVSLPASGKWETPMIRVITTEPISERQFKQGLALKESGTPLWEECEAMEAELPDSECSRCLEIIERCIWIQANYEYPGEADYASELETAAEKHRTAVCIPNLVWDERTIYIENVPVGSTGTGSLTIYNMGSGPLELYTIDIKYQSYFSIVSGDELDPIQPDEVRGIVIQFAPEDTSFRADYLRIVSNDPDNPDVEFSIYGFPEGMEIQRTQPYRR